MVRVVVWSLVVLAVGATVLIYNKVNIPGAPIPLWDSSRAQNMKCDLRIKWFEERIDEKTRKLLTEAAVSNNVDPNTLFTVISTELQDYLYSDQAQDVVPIPVGGTHGFAQMSLVPINRHKLLRRSDMDIIGITEKEFNQYRKLSQTESISFIIGMKIKRALKTSPKFAANLLAREIKYIHEELKAGFDTDLTYPKLFLERASGGGIQVKVLPPILYNVYDPKSNEAILRRAMLDYATVGAYQSDKLLTSKAKLWDPSVIYNDGVKRYYHEAFTHAENSSAWSLCFRSKEGKDWNSSISKEVDANYCRGLDSSVFRMYWPPTCSGTLKKGQKIQKCRVYLKPESYQSLNKMFLNMKAKTCQ